MLKKHLLGVVALLCNILAHSTTRLRADEQTDVVLKGGWIIDGTGAPWYAADVAVRKGRIVSIGRRWSNLQANESST